MRIVKAESTSPILLGRRGEKNVTRVEFDLKQYIRAFGEGVAQLTVKHPGDPVEYATAIEREGDTAVWTVGPECLVVDGQGFCMLSWHVDERLAKSVTYKTRVDKAMGVSDETAPEPQAGYLAQVQAAGAKAEAAEKVAVAKAAEVSETARRFDAVVARAVQGVEQVAEEKERELDGYTSHPPIVGENGNWWEWNGTAYVDSGESSRGERGLSGVYVGSGEMPEGYDVQIDPTGEIITVESLAAAVLEALPAAEGVAY